MRYYQTHVFKNKLKSSQIQLSVGEVEDAYIDSDVDQDVTQNSWQIGVYQQPSN